MPRDSKLRSRARGHVPAGATRTGVHGVRRAAAAAGTRVKRESKAAVPKTAKASGVRPGSAAAVYDVPGGGAGRGTGVTGDVSGGVDDARKLTDLAGVGKAMAKDLVVLGHPTVASLRPLDPTELYYRVCDLRQFRRDPCVHDVYACAIAQARDPALPAEECKWWTWSARRKAAGMKLVWPRDTHAAASPVRSTSRPARAAPAGTHERTQRRTPSRSRSRSAKLKRARAASSSAHATGGEGARRVRPRAAAKPRGTTRTSIKKR